MISLIQGDFTDRFKSTIFYSPYYRESKQDMDFTVYPLITDY